MGVPRSLPERVYLLAYNPDKGKVGSGTHLGAMLRAATLADLYLGGHLTDERGRATIHVRRPCDDPVLDALLEEIAAAKPHAWQSWINHRQGATFRAVRRHLDVGGWVHLRPHKILGLFPATRVTIRDPRVRDELVGRVNAVLHEPFDSIDPADAALVAIVTAADLDLVLDRKAKRANKQRIQEVTELSGPIGPALRKSIQAAAVGEV
ncbi:GPP34 family phosphoprotein [Saccharothrix sp. 6-C]|uniref:GOLPH3/VPS74 family protein n=1 Tax=Saccharothrix sp. 6-C TaxID=2781735 RepID=UPI0019174189|nr:GPP34 family phosphoprotein [Saccharothrix sp. 6-C]QQQ73653.1 GPP34 family phosphoprotein [Saccharothrix sp. 6-C]